MLQVMLVSIGLVATTVAIHAAGTHLWMRYLFYRFTDSGGFFKAHRALPAVMSTAVVLMLLHLLEVVLWAVAYLLLLPLSHLDTLEKAIYFSLVTFTTLGYGDITLAEPTWRLLSGVEALNGILLGGWTTAFLFLVVQRSWKTEGRVQDDE
ncbi:MAG: two pore domain potassium channel family protein [Gammaproteobacteria bacterium]|nr:two pore domain potassium channel family protein [Gammaproteobacteria bacterium]